MLSDQTKQIEWNKNISSKITNLTEIRYTFVLLMYIQKL